MNIKHIFFILMMAVAMVGCSNEEIATIEDLGDEKVGNCVLKFDAATFDNWEGGQGNGNAQTRAEAMNKTNLETEIIDAYMFLYKDESGGQTGTGIGELSIDASDTFVGSYVINGSGNESTVLKIEEGSYIAFFVANVSSVKSEFESLKEGEKNWNTLKSILLSTGYDPYTSFGMFMTIGPKSFYYDGSTKEINLGYIRWQHAASRIDFVNDSDNITITSITFNNCVTKTRIVTPTSDDGITWDNYSATGISIPPNTTKGTSNATAYSYETVGTSHNPTVTIKYKGGESETEKSVTFDFNPGGNQKVERNKHYVVKFTGSEQPKAMEIGDVLYIKNNGSMGWVSMDNYDPSVHKDAFAVVFDMVNLGSWVLQRWYMDAISLKEFSSTTNKGDIDYNGNLGGVGVSWSCASQGDLQKAFDNVDLPIYQFMKKYGFQGNIGSGTFPYTKAYYWTSTVNQVPVFWCSGENEDGSLKNEFSTSSNESNWIRGRCRIQRP